MSVSALRVQMQSADVLSFNMRDHIPHPYRRTGRIIVLNILVLTFLDRKAEEKKFWTK
jgi:hypothetical protein